MDKITIIDAIIFLKEKGIITDNDIEKVRNGKMTIDDLCQTASKRYFDICYLEETKTKTREIEIIDLRSEKDIILEDEIGEPKFYKFNPEAESLNIFLDLIDSYY